MKLCFFIEDFYTDKAQWTEMLTKPSRPYLMLRITFDNGDCFIPFRSNIPHEHTFFTNPLINRAGIDFTKSIFLSKTESKQYIATNKRPYLDRTEYKMMIKNEKTIKTRLIRYISIYKEAKEAIHIPRNALLIQKSTLQYFEEFI